MIEWEWKCEDCDAMVSGIGEPDFDPQDRIPHKPGCIEDGVETS